MLADAGLPVVPARLVSSRGRRGQGGGGVRRPGLRQVVSPQVLHKTDIGGVLSTCPPSRTRCVRVRSGHPAAAAPRRRGQRRRCPGQPHAPRRRRTADRRGPRPHWGPMLAWRSAASSSRCSRTRRSPRCPCHPARPAPCWTGSAVRAVLDRRPRCAPADLDALAAVIGPRRRPRPGARRRPRVTEINPLRVDGATIEALDAWSPGPGRTTADANRPHFACSRWRTDRRLQPLARRGRRGHQNAGGFGVSPPPPTPRRSSTPAHLD